MNASKEFKEAYFNYIGSITLPVDVVEMCSHQGDCTEDIKACLQMPEIKKELEDIDPEQLRKELDEYGAWDNEELSNHQDNLERILWIAAGDISDITCT